MQNLAPIIVLGGDGYLGWPLSLRLARRNPLKKIILVDNLLRRKMVNDLGGGSLLPILEPHKRLQKAKEIYALDNMQFLKMDINSEALDNLIKEARPEAVYHLAQQSSAPFSMRGCSEALLTLFNNEGGNMRLLWSVKKHAPNCHIIKLGSFGEYAKSGLDVCEGYFEPEYRGKRAQRPVPYPREADDFYHASKINDTNYISIACRKWGLRITDIMQSTIFGSWTEDIAGHSELFTRFDYDESFGTVANRFMIQALHGKPLSVYGSGHQRTGLMALNDCIESLSGLWDQLPPMASHRVVNHLTEECYSINELAETIKTIAKKEGFDVEIQRGVHDPRGENDPFKLEYSIERLHVSQNVKPTLLFDVVTKTFRMLLPYQNQINDHCLCPVTIWNNDALQPSLNVAENSVYQGRKAVPAISYEADWEVYRSRHFPNTPLNLNPGMLGTPSLDVLEAMRNFASPENLACPHDQYQMGQKAMQTTARIAEELWPTSDHALHLATSATQCANVLALTLARVASRQNRPLRVLTTPHEHIGGLGALIKMREFEVIYLSENEMRDIAAFQVRVEKSIPDIGFFSHVTFDCGQVLPVSEWSDIIKSYCPEALILVDLSQSLGLLQPPFAKTDALFSSCHKWLFGPRGSGLLWTSEHFRKKVEALYWTGDSGEKGNEFSGFTFSGGMDFSIFSGMDAALKLHQKAGEEHIRQRGVFLKNFFRQNLSSIFQKHGIQCEFIQSESDAAIEVGILAALFEVSDPYPLYVAMSKLKLHCKCIKIRDPNGVYRQILRFGFPYYETKNRLENVLLMLDECLQETLTARVKISADSDAENISTLIEEPLWSQPQTPIF